MNFKIVLVQERKKKKAHRSFLLRAEEKCCTSHDVAFFFFFFGLENFLLLSSGVWMEAAYLHDGRSLCIFHAFIFRYKTHGAT